MTNEFCDTIYKCALVSRESTLSSILGEKMKNDREDSSGKTEEIVFGSRFPDTISGDRRDLDNSRERIAVKRSPRDPALPSRKFHIRFHVKSTHGQLTCSERDTAVMIGYETHTYQVGSGAGYISTWCRSLEGAGNARRLLSSAVSAYRSVTIT